MNKDIVVVKSDLPPVLPIVALESSAVFPGMMASLHVGRGKSIQAIEKAIHENNLIGLLLPKKKLQALPAPKHSENAPEITYKFDDLYNKGISVKILKKILMPDGTLNVLVHGVQRFEISTPVHSDPYLSAAVLYFEDLNTKNDELEAMARSVIFQVKKLSEVNPFFTDDLKLAMINAPSPSALADLVGFAISLRGTEAQSFIESTDVRERFLKLMVFLRKEQDLSALQKKINEEVDSRVQKVQREFFLKEQLKSIKKELGLEEDDKTRESNKLEKKIAAANLPEHALKIAKNELSRLQTIPEMSPEFNLSRTYIDWIADLPWSKHTEDKLDLRRARKILNKHHYGLEKVKERLLEFLAVRKLNPKHEGTILCLVGPPGVGKTSLGKSVAECLGRKFFRFSLGGMRDEAEIKGHRRTYIGAMPGKILQGLKRAESNNAVLMLDEIDKVGSSFHGDPASALLEVLDPEQNHNFLDHYLDIPYDLSKVLFIATANTTHTIPPALLDRMEIIELPGYTLEEKEKIAEQFIIPRALEKAGIKNSFVKINSKTLHKIIKDYAREPGVRSLQQQMDKIARKAARIKVEKESKTPIQIPINKLDDWLGPQKFYNEVASRSQQAGIITGLAWTAMGGDILFIEAITNEGKGELKLTGQMGEVMVESAKIAMSLVKKRLGKKSSWFDKHDIHLHIPAGAVPKDGPSAGITMACALLSVIENRVAQPKMAMTGELSLTGKVLPVGGVKEKVLAAKRSGITHIIMPKLNEKDLKEIAPEHKKGLKFTFVNKIEEVFEKALKA